MQSSAAPNNNRTASQEFFRFQSNFWMNLHHTLFREGALRRASSKQPATEGTTPLSEAELSEGERHTWDNAVDYYVQKFAGRRLLFDEQLIQINTILSEQQELTKLHSPKLPPELVLILEQSAPVYRKHWWKAHNQANQAWIAIMKPAVEKMGPEVISQLEKLFNHHWEAPLSVDITYFVAEIGHAYTTERPGHTTIASSEPSNQGAEGIETIFHEGTHTLTDEVESALDVQCKAQHKPCGDLWHALQFFTVGEVVKRRLKKDGSLDFTPYAYKYRLYERGEWSRFRKVLEMDWKPYVEGKTSFDDAIKQLVKDI
jgi:hypothetical protein